MGSVQGSINSMLGSVSQAIKTVQKYASAAISPQTAAAGMASGKVAEAASSIQQLAAERARKSSKDAVAAKAIQRSAFMDHIENRQNEPDNQLSEDVGAEPTLDKQIRRE